MSAVLRLNNTPNFLKHSCHLPQLSSSAIFLSYLPQLSSSPIFLRLSHRLCHGTAAMVRLRKSLQHGAEKPYASITQNGLPYATIVPTSISATSYTTRTEPQPTGAYSNLHTSSLMPPSYNQLTLLYLHIGPNSHHLILHITWTDLSPPLTTYVVHSNDWR